MSLAEVKKQLAVGLKKELGLCGAVVIFGEKGRPETLLKKPTVLLDIFEVRAKRQGSEVEFVACVKVPLGQEAKLEECVLAITRSLAGGTEFACEEIKVKGAKFACDFVEQKVHFRVNVECGELVFRGPKVKLLGSGKVIGRGGACKVGASRKVGASVELGGGELKLLGEELVFNLELKGLKLCSYGSLFGQDEKMEVEVESEGKVYRFCNCVLESMETEFVKKRLEQAKFVSPMLKILKKGRDDFER